MFCLLATGIPKMAAGGAEYGSIEGTVKLQGRTSASKAQIILDGGSMSVCCDIDGSFTINGVLAESHAIEAAMPRYLTAQRTVVVNAGEPAKLPPVTLLGGDANLIDGVNLADLALIGANFNTKQPQYSHTDINNDNIVDICDLVIAGSNFDKTQSPWP